MKKKIIVVVFLIIALIISGCSSKDIDSFNEEKEQLTNEIVDLQQQILEKDEKINKLQDSISNLIEERDGLIKSIEMIRFSSYSRLNDYKDSFDNLKNVYKINSNYTIKDDWYVINGDYFEIELVGYEYAKK